MTSHPTFRKTLLLSLLFSASPIAAKDPIRLGVSDKKIDIVFDLDMGIHMHQIPGTAIILSQGIKGPLEKEIDKALKLDVNGLTREMLVDAFSGENADPAFTLSGDAEGDALDIQPWTYLQAREDGRYQPWTIWNVQCLDLYWNKKKWAGLCLASLSKPMSIEAWAANEGKELKRALLTDTRKLLTLTRTDLKNGFQKLPSREMRVKAHWAGWKEEVKLKIGVREPDKDTWMVNSWAYKDAQTFMAAGFTGLLFKAINKNSFLFDGTCVVPKDYGEIVPSDKRAPTGKDTGPGTPGPKP